MATNIGTLAADVALLNDLVQFANRVLLGSAEENAEYRGEEYPTRAKLAASFLLGLNTYPTIDDGLANTSENGFFQIVSDVDREYVVLYQVVNGSAEVKKRYPSSTAIDLVEDAAVRAESSEQAAALSEQNAALSEDRAEGFAGQAQTASEASGNVLFFDNYADADAATLSDGQVVEVFADETKQGRNTRYRFETDTLVYKPRNISYSDQPGFGHSKTITEDPLYAENSNYLLIGPDIYIGDDVNFSIPSSTDVTITSGTEFTPNA